MRSSIASAKEKVQYAALIHFSAICGLVIGIHLSLIFWFSYNKDVAKPLPPPRKLLVQTVELKVKKVEEQKDLKVIQEAKDLNVPQEIKEVKKLKEVKDKKEIKDTPKEIPPPQKKKEVAKPAEKPPAKPQNIPKPIPKKIEPVKDLVAEAAAVKKKKLLAEAQESLKKSTTNISAGEKTQKSTLAEPPKALSGQTNSIDNSSLKFGMSLNENYSQALVIRLKRLLKLPQYGDVDIQLTLLRSGKVAKFMVVSSQNQANKEHLEKTVPTLTFPSFGNSFAGEESHTFNIKLSNEINS